MNVLRLKELLKEKGMSGKELSEKVSVSENTISFISTGKTQPRFELLKHIAEVLDVDIRELFISTKNKHESDLFIKDKEGQLKKIGIVDLKKLN